MKLFLQKKNAFTDWYKSFCVEQKKEKTLWECDFDKKAPKKIDNQQIFGCAKSSYYMNHISVKKNDFTASLTGFFGIRKLWQTRRLNFKLSFNGDSVNSYSQQRHKYSQYSRLCASVINWIHDENQNGLCLFDQLNFNNLLLKSERN